MWGNPFFLNRVRYDQEKEVIERRIEIKTAGK